MKKRKTAYDHLHKEKAYDKIQQPFMMKMLSKLKNSLSLRKGIYVKCSPNIIFNEKTIKFFLPKIKDRQECPLSPLRLNSALKVLDSGIKEEIKSNPNRKK